MRRTGTWGVLSPPTPIGRRHSLGEVSRCSILPSTGSTTTGCGYNGVYFERGTNIAIVNGEFRSSLLTNPSDGRRPALTPEGERRGGCV